jgi:hypothetical protein
MTRKNGDRILVVAGRSTPGSDGGKNSDGGGGHRSGGRTKPNWWTYKAVMIEVIHRGSLTNTPLFLP